MSLKDASAYNIQFHEGRPVLIDSLSFTRLPARAHPGSPTGNSASISWRPWP